MLRSEEVHMRRSKSLFVMSVAIVFFSGSSGCDKHASARCSAEAASSFVRSVLLDARSQAGGFALSSNRVCQCLTNAFFLAERRRFQKGNSDVIPMYCLLRSSACEDGAFDGRSMRVTLDLWGFGERKAWDADLDRVWIVLERKTIGSSGCEITTSPLANLIHGQSSSWSRLGYGHLQYRCHDLLLGLKREARLVEQIREGECCMYLLLAEGRSFGFRIGRVVRARAGWLESVNDMMGRGVLVPLSVVAQADGGVLLECK